MRKYQGPWREERATTKDYPGLYVSDGVSSGSIRIDGGPSLWAMTADVIELDWEFLKSNWGDGNPGMTERDFGLFLHHLFQQRGEFGRLVCVLADVERRDRYPRPWWATKTQRRRMIKQLQRCIDALQEEEAALEARAEGLRK